MDDIVFFHGQAPALSFCNLSYFTASSLGWTQAELTRRLVTTRFSVNAWESGISMPSTQYIVELSRIFHVSTDYLFGLKQNQTLDVSGLPPEQIATFAHLVEFLRLGIS